MREKREGIRGEVFEWYRRLYNKAELLYGIWLVIWDFDATLGVLPDVKALNEGTSWSSLGFLPSVFFTWMLWVCWKTFSSSV